MSSKPVLIISAGNTFPSLCAVEGDFDEWIAAGLGSGVEQVRLNARSTDELPAPNGFAGVVVSGSHSMVSDREAWSERLAQWLKQCVDINVPVLGICYGHQLLAHALGGHVANLPGGPEVGSKTIQLTAAAEDDPLFSGLPGCFPAQLIHYQSVLSLPEGAELLAQSALEPHQAFRFGSRAWGVQFHPEFSANAMRGYVQEVANDLGDAPQLLEEIVATPEAGSILRRFAQLVADSDQK